MAWIRAVCTWNMDQKTVKPGYWHLAHLPGHYLTPSAELFMKQSRRDEAGLNPANLPIGPPHPATRQLKPAQAGEEFSQLPASITVTVTGTAESARLNSWELSVKTHEIQAARVDSCMVSLPVIGQLSAIMSSLLFNEFSHRYLLISSKVMDMNA